MDLLDLLAAMRDMLGHDNVRWDAENGEIRIYTGLTMRNEDGIVESGKTMKWTRATKALMEME